VRDPEFEHTVSNRLGVTKVAKSDTVDPNTDPCTCPNITKPMQPLPEQVLPAAVTYTSSMCGIASTNARVAYILQIGNEIEAYP